MQLSPQLQQLPFCSFLLKRLIEYHTPVSLVEACLGPQWRNFNIPQWFFLHPEALGINQICPPSDCISFVFVSHLESSRVSLYRSENAHGVNPEPPGGSWEKNNGLSCKVQESPQEARFRCVGYFLYSPECLVWVRSSRDNEQRPPIGKERGADWFRTRSETLVLGVCS